MKFIILTAGFFILIQASQASKRMKAELSGDQFDDFNLTTVEIIKKYGYPAETHTTETEDGYILVLHRIPHGKNSTEPGLPILVAHQFFADSSNYLLSGNRSIGFFLADEGYDVWLINFRGTFYTRTHKNLSSEDSKFWDFSAHELGVYDLPAHINYICNYTQKQEILYFGHSMGTTVFFIMASERPEYQNKIRGAVIAAPVAVLKYSTLKLRFFLIPLTKIFQFISKPRLIGGFFQDNDSAKKFIRFVCGSTILNLSLCKYVLFVANGAGSKVFDERTIMNMFSHISGTSTKLLEHFTQRFLTSKFSQYDYGKAKNLAIYNHSSPPEYKMESIITPMSVFVSLNDAFATPKNVFETFKGVRSVKGFYVNPEPSFSHFDFLLARGVEKTLYPAIASQLKNFNTECRVNPQGTQ